MVATLLGLKLRLTLAEFKRSVARLVLWIIFGVYALFIVAMALAGLAAASMAVGGNEAMAQAVTVVSGSLIVLGWTFLPLAFFGSDQTLDPARFTPFPLRGRQLSLGLVLGGIVGIPGLMTAILSLGAALPWLGAPAALVAGLVGGALGFVISQIGCRVAAAAFSGALSSRKGRDRSAMIGLIVILLLSLLGYGASLIVNWFASDPDRWKRVLEVSQPVGAVLAWTPLGAPWALAGDVAQGNWLLGAGHLAVSGAYVWLGLRLYGAILDHMLVTPTQTEVAATVVKGDAVARAASWRWAKGALAPVAVIMARCLRYWRRDPRYLGTIPVLLILPILFTVIGVTMGTVAEEVPAFITTGYIGMGLGLTAMMAGYALSADLASDSTAWWIHLVSGVKGWQDRLGRVLADLVWAAPLIVVVTVAMMAVLGHVGRLPGALGASLVLYLTALGVSSVASALIVYPVALPGESPLKTKTGMMGSQMLSQFGCMLVSGLLALPVCVWAVMAGGWQGWLVLLVGVVWGLAVLAAGVVLGGRIMDSRAPAIMATLVKNDTRQRA